MYWLPTKNTFSPTPVRVLLSRPRWTLSGPSSMRSWTVLPVRLWKRGSSRSCTGWYRAGTWLGVQNNDPRGSRWAGRTFGPGPSFQSTQLCLQVPRPAQTLPAAVRRLTCCPWRHRNGILSEDSGHFCSLDDDRFFPESPHQRPPHRSVL